MRRARSSGFLVVLVGALAGCGGDSPSVVTVADSAGVQIVTNLPGSFDSAERWRLSDEPAVEVGAGADPDLVLFRVAAIAPLNDGRVAVGSNGPPQVQIFGADGALIATLGRAGRGPGEFASVGSLVALAGDTVAVWDPDRRRVSIFTDTGQLTREVDLSEIAPPTVAAAPNTNQDAGFTHLFPATSDSWFLFTEAVFSSTLNDGIDRPRLPAYRISTEGAELTRLGDIPGMTMLFGSPMGTVPLPLGARTYAAVSEGNLVVASGEQAEFRVLAPNGSLTRIVRWPEKDRSVGGRHLSMWSEMVDSQPAFREAVELMPRPELLPAFEGMISTGSGDILIGEYAGPTGIWPTRRAESVPEMMRPQRRVPERQWLVFGSDGARKAFIGTPEGFEPYTVHEGIMWGVFTDELDVESVRGYHLTM